MSTHIYSHAYASKEQLAELLVKCQELGVKSVYISKLRMLATMPPPGRLKYNINSLLRMAAYYDIDDFLQKAFTPFEHEILTVLDSSGLPIHLREVAHGLFNVHERWVMLKAMSKSLNQASAASAQHLERPTPDRVQSEVRI